MISVLHRELKLTKAAKGFILYTDPQGPGIGLSYAFNEIQEVADWLVAHYEEKSND